MYFYHSIKLLLCRNISNKLGNNSFCCDSERKNNTKLICSRNSTFNHFHWAWGVLNPLVC